MQRCRKIKATMDPGEWGNWMDGGLKFKGRLRKDFSRACVRS